MPDIKEGTILVAHEDLGADPVFGRSVILILHHDDQGTIGVNIAGECLNEKIFVGGPIFDAPLLLHDQESDAGSRPIGESGYAVRPVETLDPQAEEELIERESSLVLFGYAGWAANQLTDELSIGIWGVSVLDLPSILAAPVEERFEFASQNADFAG